MSVEENLKIVLEDIQNVASKSKGASKDLQLIAVSKTHNADKIRPVIEAGQRVFGENRVQEAQGKWPELKSEIPNIELHLIGPLQSNKTVDAIELFDVIQSVDREKIAKTIQKEAVKIGKCPDLYVQVNTGLEPQKAGIAPQDAVAFVKHCKNDLSLPIIGLMCIPPNGENPGPHFALLQKLAEEAGVENLSMGMSSDYQTAIEFGATHVRVGSAIFGERYKI
ncbi:YggS family pyridoxal phosphate-dependent enzyme [Lentilitoribacter sp. Alg239-R112]|uniref:YggS family pyridoxal phosphate-dependent enzyme n=1 Tax=Lentilitoribacter sp. Alg239-R112 TaxID=2305987 RepID=UPI0013A6982E|nr:YggS family pyridoxal phosphate-dependent enzyme [Lentilitoribacter sp. Alg239-R112]